MYVCIFPLLYIYICIYIYIYTCAQIYVEYVHMPEPIQASWLQGLAFTWTLFVFVAGQDLLSGAKSSYDGGFRYTETACTQNYATYGFWDLIAS